MKTRKSILALVILLVLLFMQEPATGGGFWTGNELVKNVSEHDKYMAGVSGVKGSAVTLYQGYVSGIADALEGTLWLSPDNVTIDQICAIVSKYLKGHPERWNEPAVNLVVDALQEAFPLPKKK